MLTTTLNRIRAHSPCVDGWTKLLTHLGKTKADDEPLSFETILAANGLYDALWCLRAEPQHARQYRLFAVWCARQVQHLMTDPRSLAALDVAERHANGGATDAELDAARAAASAAARAAAWAAWAASDAARAAASAAELSAASDAAWAAARAAASAAVGDAAWADAWDAARDAQRARFLEMVRSVPPEAGE